MTQTLEAVFENGKFRLLERPAVPLRDGQHVRLTVETEATQDDVLVLAEQVYAGLSDEEVAGVEHIALDRRSFFDRRHPHDRHAYRRPAAGDLLRTPGGSKQ